jgi:hypothetical protein
MLPNGARGVNVGNQKITSRLNFLCGGACSINYLGEVVFFQVFTRLTRTFCPIVWLSTSTLSKIRLRHHSEGLYLWDVVFKFLKSAAWKAKQLDKKIGQKKYVVVSLTPVRDGGWAILYFPILSPLCLESGGGSPWVVYKVQPGRTRTLTMAQTAEA